MRMDARRAKTASRSRGGLVHDSRPGRARTKTPRKPLDLNPFKRLMLSLRSASSIPCARSARPSLADQLTGPIKGAVISVTI